MLTRRAVATMVTAGSVLAIRGPVAGASAPAASSDRTPGRCAPSTPIERTFVPPKVGPIAVAIGPTIIGGVVVDPGMQVSTPGVTGEPCVPAGQP
jgi:hypothetical protein